jgi:hypothetical protein
MSASLVPLSSLAMPMDVSILIQQKAVQRPGQQGPGGATVKYDRTFISRIIHVCALLKESWHHTLMPFPGDTFKIMM